MDLSPTRHLLVADIYLSACKRDDKSVAFGGLDHANNSRPEGVQFGEAWAQIHEMKFSTLQHAA